MINDEKQLREDFAKYGDDIIREMLIEYSLLPNEIEETVSFFHPYVEKLYNHELSFDVFHSVEKLATESIYNMASYKDGNTALVDLVACVDLEKLGKKIIELDPDKYLVLSTGTVIWYEFSCHETLVVENLLYLYFVAKQADIGAQDK